ncbi:MAG: hypothetical protein K0S07_1506 [Chlamydiales bacterium]|jgi:hypothetical protein|nr:hypothetical protein [Chlamydiales bacterium]
MKKIFLFKSLSAAFLLSSVQATEVFQNKPHAVSSQERLDIGTKIKNCREILALFAHDNAQVLAAFDASALAWQSYYQQKQG